MAREKKLVDEIDDKTKLKKDLFLKNLNSNMFYESNYSGNDMTFEWLDQLEFACPFIDNVVRKPKLALVKEEIIVNAERTKKVTVESIKHLAKHTNYINKVDPKTNDVEPKKILNVINEETFNIYENRFLFTLFHDMDNFIRKKEEELKNYKLVDSKLLEYSASTDTDLENVNIELRVTSETFPSDKKDKAIQDEIKKAKTRLKKVKDYLSSWTRSEMYKEIDKANIRLINPPLKKTNIILKNPNFQVASKLWDYILKYNEENDDSKENLEKDNNPLQDFIDHSFLINFCVLDSISRTKREQKEKMSQYAIIMLTEEIRRTISLLLNCGIKITDEELLGMISKELQKEKNNRLVGAEDVKKKFKNAMDEYLERMQDYL